MEGSKSEGEEVTVGRGREKGSKLFEVKAIRFTTLAAFAIHTNCFKQCTYTCDTDSIIMVLFESSPACT